MEILSEMLKDLLSFIKEIIFEGIFGTIWSLIKLAFVLGCGMLLMYIIVQLIIGIGVVVDSVRGWMFDAWDWISEKFQKK